MNSSTRSLAAPVSARLARVSRIESRSSGSGQGRLQIKRDPLRIALFVLTILTISRVHQAYPLLEKLRPALLLVVASVGYAYLNPRYLNRNALRLWPMRLVAALGILACCSVAFGISLGGSALFILDSYVKTLTYAFLIAVSIRHVRDLYTFVWAYVLSCGILSFFSLFVFGISRASGSYVTRLNNLYTYDSNDLGVVMMVGLPLTLLLLTVERGAKRLSLATILIGIAATMARSGSRGGFLGFVAVGLGGLILIKDVSAARKLIILAAASVALAVGAPDGYWKQMGTILAPKADYNYSDIDGRKAVMERGMGYMAEYPVFGLGINNFSRAECTISPKLALLRRNGPMRCTPHGIGRPRVVGFRLARNGRNLRSPVASSPPSEVMAPRNTSGKVHLQRDELFRAGDGRVRCHLFLRVIRLDGSHLLHGRNDHGLVCRRAGAIRNGRQLRKRPAVAWRRSTQSLWMACQPEHVAPHSHCANRHRLILRSKSGASEVGSLLRPSNSCLIGGKKRCGVHAAPLLYLNAA
jgi:hypothetical protein